MNRLIQYLPLFISSLVFSQQDTVVITDYTKVLFEIDKDGEVSPLASLENADKAGFFINQRPEGKIKICHPDIFIWVNGRLLDNLSDCKIFDPKDLYKDVPSDTLYISLSSDIGLEDLKCELIIFEELLIIKDETSIPREIRDSHSEFIIIALLSLLVMLGLIISSQPSRISYIASKTFTFKISAYEFVNTSFYSAPSLYLLTFFSFLLAFSGIYLDSLLSLGWIEASDSVGLLWAWIQCSVVIFLALIIKWFIVSLTSQLFYFRDLKNYQLFDFLNFNLVFLLPVTAFIVIDFIFNRYHYSWISTGFLIVFPVILILFVLWFTLKFVNNSTRRKLVIISYLCATEIIPAVILLGWFFK